jgi:hypothetical protein
VSISISPISANVASGGTQQFAATVNNSSNQAVTWTASNGSISTSGLFTAPSVGSTTNVTVKATSVADPTQSAQASVSVSPVAAVSVSITPPSANVTSGGNQQFSATVSNTSNPAVTWATSNGTVSSSGLLSAPNVTSTTTLTVTATSVADSTKSAQAMVTVDPIAPPPPAAGGGDNMYCGPGNVPNFGSSDGPAQLPQTCLYTARAGTPSNGNVTFVPSGNNIQGVLNAANCGDTIQLQAGGTFNGPVIIPAKSCDDNHWITVETSGIASLPPAGTRLTPCYAGMPSLPGRPAYSCPNPQNVMAKILTSGNGTGPVLDASSGGVNHYRFIGLELTRTVGSGPVYYLVDLGANQPSNKMIFDQVWMHGLNDKQVTQTPGGPDETRTGLEMFTASNIALIDSYVSDLYCVSNIGTCTEGQTITWGVGAASSTSTTFKVVNNFLEAGGENLLSGGDDWASANPADLEIRRNHIFKPLTWNPADPSYDGGSLGGNPPTVKNDTELKNATRVLFEGNIFENNWNQSQTGHAILLNAQDYQAACKQGQNNCEVSNITLRYNLIRRSAGLEIAQGGVIGSPLHNISIHDDVIDHLDYSSCLNCNTYINETLILSNSTPAETLHDLTINHITEVLDNQGGVSLGFASGPLPSTGAEMYNFVWKNSILPAGQYGYLNGGNGPQDCGNNDNPSTPNISQCFTGTTLFGSNLIAWGSVTGGSWASLGGQAASVLVADQNAVQYANLVGQDYHLQASSPGHAAADDGKDIGADTNAVNTYTQGVQ